MGLPSEWREPIELIVPRAGKSMGLLPPNIEDSDIDARSERGGGGFGVSPVMGLVIRFGRGRENVLLARPIGPEAFAMMAASEEEMRPGLPPSCDGP